MYANVTINAQLQTHHNATNVFNVGIACQSSPWTVQYGNTMNQAIKQ